MDLLNPLDGLLARFQHGQMHRFTWSGTGWSGYDVEELLARYGIPMWGREVSFQAGDDFGGLVKARQAVWAEYLLARAGVPLTSPYLSRRNQVLGIIHGGTLPPAWGVPARVQGLVGPIIRVLVGIFGHVPHKLPIKPSPGKMAKPVMHRRGRGGGRRRGVISRINGLLS
jgi:hypothetical protein